MDAMSQPAAGMLKHYLEQRQLAGQTHAALRPGTLDRMRDVRQPKAMRQQPSKSTPPPTVAERPTASERAPVARAAPLKTSPKLIEVTGATKAEKLAALAAIAETSPEARALGTLRETMVFAKRRSCLSVRHLDLKRSGTASLSSDLRGRSSMAF